MTQQLREYRVGTGRTTLSVRERRGGSPPVVFLHDLGCNARWWDLVGDRLAPAHQVIAVDQRGHGQSDRPDDGYGFDSVAADLDALIGKLGLAPAIIAGHGWGASVALWHAAQSPGTVLGTACVDGGVLRLRDHVGDTWDLAAVAMAPPELVGLTRRRLAQWVSASPIIDGSDAETATDITLGNLEDDPASDMLRPRLTIDRHMAIARSLYDLDPADLLRRQSRPVLLVPAGGGDLDDARRATVAAGLAQLGRIGSVVWIDGVHDLPLQHPAGTADAIRGFAAGLA
jgi:pimeloyl-ACP methyl ester carboxylesterase